MGDKVFEHLLKNIKEIRMLEREIYNEGYKKGYEQAKEDFEMATEIKNKRK